MHRGESFGEYVQNVDGYNRYFHEVAEQMRLSKEGGMRPILPLRPDDDDDRKKQNAVDRAKDISGEQSSTRQPVRRRN